MKRFYILFFLFFLCIYLGYSQDDNCILDAGVELIPAPTIDPVFTNLSTYASETTVQMCYEVEAYNTPGTQNWMHGIVPSFGPGWDLSTLQPVGQPESQGNFGEWIWTGDVVAGITGELISPSGWWYDSTQGANGASLDGDPSNNWGDGNNGPWTFCWEITTQSCPPAFNEANLIVEILNFADSETGSWNNSANLNQCIDDPSYYIQGIQLDCPTCDESGLTVVDPTCETIDETAGVVVVTPSGIGPWNYIWFNLDSGEIVEENNNVTLPVTVSGLEPAEYLIQVEDLGFAGGCSAPVYFEILPPEEIVVEFDIVDANCSDTNDGSILVSSIMNSNCIDSSLIAEDSNGDGVIDNDDFSCPSTADEVCGCDFLTYFNACQAENWYGISSYTEGECSGFPNYNITWVSNNSIDSPNWDGELINLFPGDYTVYISNEDNTSPVFGCDFETTVTVGSPEEFIYDFTVNDVSCFIDDDGDGINDVSDGSISIELSGGTAGYVTTLGFQIGGIIDSQNGSNVVFDNLGVGDYYFTPVDFFGCLVTEQEVFFSISEPEPLSVSSISFSDYNGFGVSCNGGSDGIVDIEIVGGTPPYNFEWSNDTSDQNLTNANAGTYSVLVSCSNDCELLVDNLTLTEPLSVSIEGDITPVSCSGASDGSIILDVEGGVGSYSFSWSGPGGFNSTSSDISSVPTGFYTVVVTDENDCDYEATFNVTTPNPIVINESINNISCFGFNDGSIDITISGGNAPYTFEWSSGDFNEDITDLSPGGYSVIVTDSEDCFETATYIIEEPALLTATVISTSNVDCFGNNTGNATISIVGGTPPYTESWSGGANPDNLFAGTYSVVITDLNGCTDVINDIVIDQPNEELLLNAEIIDVFPCNGDQTGSITPFATGGTPPYQYNSNGAGNLNTLFSDTYTISVEDANGCVTEMDFFVDEPDVIVSNIAINPVSCFGLCDGSVSSSPTGGMGPYILTWSTLSGSPIDNTNLCSGFYLLSIEDALGCIYTESFFMEEPSESDMQILLPDQPSCLDSFDVSVFGSGALSGSWSGSGPGGLIFSNPSDLETSVTVFDYGLYELIFTNDCGEKTILNINMLAIPPNAYASPSIVYCDFEADLNASSESDEGYWTVEEFPDNTDVTIDNPNSFNPHVSMTAIDASQECCYGDYVFEFSSCGASDLVHLSVEKNAPDLGYSTFTSCSLESEIIINNPISFTDALMDPGSWEWEPIGGHNGTVNVYYETPHEIAFSVSEYGLYEFRYLVCDTFYQKVVGFSCPLELPNAFSPNGDENNDFFLGNQLIPFVHTQINFTVYNRFGQVVHSQSQYNFQNNLWDGTTNEFSNRKLEDGVYYYTLDLYNTASHAKEKYTGYVHLFGHEE